MKYKLTNNFINVENKKLYKIEALKDFLNIKKGQFGGYIESEENLSQEGNCWIYGNGKVYDNAKVSGNATIEGSAEIFDSAEVSGNAYIAGNAKVFGNAKVSGNAYATCQSEIDYDLN